MTEVEKLAKEYFEQLGFKIEGYAKNEMRIPDNKTPDFKVYRNDELVFYCEHKEIEEDKRNFNEENQYTQKDNIYDIISYKINDAGKKFQSVNSNHKIPNVLFFYNNRPKSEADIVDCIFTHTGNFYTNSSKIIPAFKKISEGRIKEKKKLIDLYIWQNKTNNKIKFCFNCDSSYLKKLCELFNEDPNKLKIATQ